MKKILPVVLMFISATVQAQLTFDTSKPIDTLIQDFIGNGVTLSNVTFTGGPNSIGSFTGNSSLGSSQGIVFSTGNIDSNIAMAAVTFLTQNVNMPGNADLTALVNGMPTFDAAVLEFDFIATNNTLLFDYVFASEEYNEFAGSSFNDVFAFFISGPGIIGQQNIALIPNTSTVVAINNVNNGSTGNGPCTNCTYFHDNTNDTTNAFDGFTVPLTATYTLTPGQTYHLKLAVADVADQIFDTGVFLQKYSLRSVNLTAISDAALENLNVIFFDNVLKITFPESLLMYCSIYNLNGSKVYESELRGGYSSIPFSVFPDGMYSVKLQVGNKSVVKQFVKF